MSHISAFELILWTKLWNVEDIIHVKENPLTSDKDGLGGEEDDEDNGLEGNPWTLTLTW